MPPQPDSYVFWDGIHPTKAMHAIIAQRAIETIFARGTASFSGLGQLSVGAWGKALGISGDGSFVVGYSGTDAFRWSQQGGMESLGATTPLYGSIGYSASTDG